MNYGVTTEEAALAVISLMSCLPPIGEAEIELIEKNPSLSRLQKWRLKRFIRKSIK